MIHSLAGGSIRDISFLDFAKVEILEGVQKGSWFWYITDIPNLKAQDEVFVPLGATNQRTRVRSKCTYSNQKGKKSFI